VWKLRPIQLVLTLVGLTLVAAVAFMLAVSGPIASAVGGAIGLVISLTGASGASRGVR
jgi:membrane protein